MNSLPVMGGYTPADFQNMGMPRLDFKLRRRHAAQVTNLNAPPPPSIPEPPSLGLTALDPEPFGRGCAYRDIIRNLNAQGDPGFNKVNLHTWKKTGFQNWLRKEEPRVEAA